MENVTIKINGMEVTAPKGSTILEAARLAHIEIPTLCFLKEINEIGACRSVVEVKGARSLEVLSMGPKRLVLTLAIRFFPVLRSVTYC